MRHVPPCHSPAPARKGVVLVAVLVVVVLLSLAAYQYSELMIAEAKACDNAMKLVQAKALADSGVHYVAAVLSNPDNFSAILNGRPFDNEQVFANVPVASNDTSGTQWRFSIVGPLDANDSGSGSTFRYGPQCESAKINLNACMKLDPTGKVLYDMLLKLPNMTDEIANCILDWLDADGEPRNGGAENDYYQGLSPPYRCKNGPLDSLEELLLVKGVTPELLFGNDKNRNSFQDEGEEGNFERGWSAFLTVYSRELNTDAQGVQLTYINGTDAQALYDKLVPEVGEDLAKFIILYRQYGPSNTKGSTQSVMQSLAAVASSLVSGGKTTSTSSNTSTSSTTPGSLGALTLDMTKKPNQKLSSFFDLINTQVTVPSKDPKGKSVLYSSPLNDPTQLADLLPKLFSAASIFDGAEIPSRINVNTAPREVLLAIPGLTEADVDLILANRHKWSSNSTPEEIEQTLAWLLVKAKIKPDTIKQLEKYITTRTQVYRVQSVGFMETQGPSPSGRVEAVIDVNGGRPRILFWRDLSELGKGLDMQK